MMAFVVLAGVSFVWRPSPPQERVFKLTVKVPDGISGGTGFLVVAPSGRVFMVSNAHVCRLAENGSVLAFNQARSTMSALTVIKTDPGVDLCLLSPVRGADAFRLGVSPDPGQVVTIIGHPLLGNLLVSRGLITSSFGPDVFATARVLGGNSGSPVVDNEGRLVGVVRAQDTRDLTSVVIDVEQLRTFLRGL